MTKFDARIVARNQRSNKIIDEVKKKAPNSVERNMVDRVLRPYIHIMNECEIHDMDPELIYDATIAMASAAMTEMLVRTIPKGNETLLHGVVQTVFTEFSESFLKSLSVNFDVKFEQAHAPARVPTVLQH